MEMPTPMSSAVAVCAAFAVLAAGCGEDQQYASDPRPPAPVSLTAAVSGERISLSPTRIGAGPVNLTVVNLSNKSVDVSLTSVGGTDATASSGPINPKDTATLAVDVREGRYRLSAKPDAAPPAKLTVGVRRASAENDVLLP